jgi:hypothetical protein
LPSFKNLPKCQTSNKNFGKKKSHHTWLKRDEQPHTNEKKHINRNKMPKPRPLFAIEKKVSSPPFDE